MKKDAYYFSHFSNARHDRKIKRLRKELGIEGYGIYFMLLEVLREQLDFKYPICDIDLLSEEFGTSEAKLITVIKSYDLFEIIDGHFTSLKFIFYLTPYIEKSQRARDAAQKRWKQINANADANAMQMQCKSECKESIVKESKVNESKGDEAKKSFSTISESFKMITIDECKKEYISDAILIESVCINLKRTNVEILALLDTFTAKLINEGEQTKTLKDFKSHFFRWAKLQSAIKPNQEQTTTIKKKYL